MFKKKEFQQKYKIVFKEYFYWKEEVLNNEKSSVWKYEVHAKNYF